MRRGSAAHRPSVVSPRRGATNTVPVPPCCSGSMSVDAMAVTPLWNRFYGSIADKKTSAASCGRPPTRPTCARHGRAILVGETGAAVLFDESQGLVERGHV